MTKIELCKKYNISISSLNQYLAEVPGLERVNLKKVSKFTPYEIQCMVNEWGEPAPFINKKQLALNYKISRQTLGNWLNIHCIKFKHTLISPAEQVVIKKFFG